MSPFKGYVKVLPHLCLARPLHQYFVLSNEILKGHSHQKIPRISKLTQLINSIYSRVNLKFKTFWPSRLRKENLKKSKFLVSPQLLGIFTIKIIICLIKCKSIFSILHFRLETQTQDLCHLRLNNHLWTCKQNQGFLRINYFFVSIIWKYFLQDVTSTSITTW